MKFKHLCIGLAVGALAAFPSFGSTIDLGINGDAKVGSNFINFGNYPLGSVYTPAPGYGTIVVSQPPLGIFLAGGVTASETGKIQSLSAAMTPPGTILTPNPVTAAPFMTFDAGGSNLEIFLTELAQGTTGPFDLVNTSNGAVASFGIDGFIYNTTTHAEEAITGTFAATFNGMTVDQLKTASATSGVATPFSGTFSVTAVPEPATLAFVGFALLGAGLIFRRRLTI